MSIDFDVETNQFEGTQQLTYWNNSPDTLQKVFYHLYYNAFQPGSMMDVRSRSIVDPDRRVQDRISKLEKDEIGYHEIKALDQNGKPLNYLIEGTVMEVVLADPLLPNTSTVFNLTFQSQVPVQIRRTGRHNKEGIAYSMTQWYPKMAAYDERGWHAHPYVGREFYAPFGSFDVSITLNKTYVVAASGTLQNPDEIGYGYTTEKVKLPKRNKKLTWHFIADNVHDFAWAADPDYTHKIAQVPDGPTLHFFYQPGEKTKAWDELIDITPKAFAYMEQNFGKYPYSHYSVIQGGDGGMEYPMATLINGAQSIRGLLSVTVHEAFHSWYQGVLGFNESYYSWMDEGFTSYSQDQTLSFLKNGSTEGAQSGNYQNYIRLTQSGKEEPMTTHADHYTTNFGYSLAAYVKGAVALSQMNYLVGEKVTLRTQKKFYNQWKFKHPTPNDWIRVFEKETDLELDWYLDHWVNTTHTIDYAIQKVEMNETNTTTVSLEKLGVMPMPIDLYVTLKDGTKKIYYMPISIMRGEKENDTAFERVTLKDWPWTNSSYEVVIDHSIEDILSIEIDESGYMADVDRSNNKWEAAE